MEIYRLQENTIKKFLSFLRPEINFFIQIKTIKIFKLPQVRHQNGAKNIQWIFFGQRNVFATLDSRYKHAAVHTKHQSCRPVTVQVRGYGWVTLR